MTDLRDWHSCKEPRDIALTGRTVRLTPLDASVHTSDLFRANSADDDMWAFLPYGPFSSEAGYHRWVRDAVATKGMTYFAVQNLETGRYVGVLGYLNIEPDHGCIEIGNVAFSQSLQRTTCATEAVFLLMKWAFDAGYRRVEWKCNAANVSSRRAAQRFGFSYEGVFRQHRIVKGANRDTAYFAATDHDWRALSAAYEAWLSVSNFDPTGRQNEHLGNLTALVRVASDPILPNP